MASPPAVEKYGIRVLDLEQSRALESRSLNRFPHTSSGVIGWDAVDGAEHLTFANEDEGRRLIGQLVSHETDRASEVAVFWGTLVMPTVTLTAGGVVDHAAAIFDAAPQFWLYLREAGKLIECVPDGSVTLCRIPED
jgi:hypothetical protein